MSLNAPVAPASATPEAPAEVRAETSHTPQDVFDAAPRRRAGTVVALVVAIIVLSIAVLAVLGYLLLALGGQLTFFGAILALVPLAIVLLGVRWIDRWEPEPRLLQVLAFTWGAAMAVLVALVVDAGVSELLAAGEADLNYTVFLQTVVQAPIVEESAKAFGVLLVYLAARRYFDGPVDGIVYAALVAGGFAFTENIQYFALQIAESGRFDVAVGEIFFIRGLLSPFAHVLFTACAGFLIGVAARRGSAIGGILAFVAGLVPAILLHAFWNGALFFTYDFYAYYLLVQVPIFVVAVLIVAWLRRREAQMTQRHLADYAAAGWFHPDEVAVLGTWAGRRQATAWARSRGASAVMRAYIRDATSLAFTRNRIVSGRDRLRSGQTEAALLAQVTESRRRLAAL